METTITSEMQISTRSGLGVRYDGKRPVMKMHQALGQNLAGDVFTILHLEDWSCAEHGVSQGGLPEEYLVWPRQECSLIAARPTGLSGLAVASNRNLNLKPIRGMKGRRRCLQRKKNTSRHENSVDPGFGARQEESHAQGSFPIADASKFGIPLCC